jgi:hypothetical protein
MAALSLCDAPGTGKIFEKFGLTSRDGGIRTRDLLLPNQLLLAARHRPTRPYVASTCEDSRSMPLEAAWLRCLLAPTLAPYT